MNISLLKVRKSNKKAVEKAVSVRGSVIIWYSFIVPGNIRILSAILFDIAFIASS